MSAQEPDGNGKADPKRDVVPTDQRAFLAMIERAGVGHGLRDDFRPPGTAVQIETENGDGDVTTVEFWFDESGRLKTVHCYESDLG